jgi:RsiW-degrading membrane proteinase PrsW (M82 family)
VVWLFIFPQKVFDEPIDAMIYMMFSALGFAFFENLVLALSSTTSNVVMTLFYRFFGANLLHILASSLIGYGYAFFVKTRRIFPFVLSFISGTFLHFLYNYLIISLLPGFILVLPILWTVFLVVLSELNYLSKNG